MIEFTKDYTVQDAEGKKYRAGERVSLRVASELHFIRRGVAVYVDGPTLEDHIPEIPEEVKKNPVESAGSQQPAPVSQGPIVKRSRGRPRLSR